MPSFFINGRAIHNIDDLADDDEEEEVEEEEEGEEDDNEEEQMEEAEGYQDDNYLSHHMNNNLGRIIGAEYLNDLNTWNNPKNLLVSTSKRNPKGANNKKDQAKLNKSNPVGQKDDKTGAMANKRNKSGKDRETSYTFDPASFLDLCFNTNHQLESMC